MRRTIATLSLILAVAALAVAAACGTSQTGCPQTPGHCLPGYRFNTTTCGCEPVPCASNADCQSLGQVVCDKVKGTCAASDTVAACAPVFTCTNAIKPGGTCNCHLDCQCDPGNTSGAGATYCVGAGGNCMPRCTDQPDPAMFCDCYSLGTTCAPNGWCARPCKTLTDCSTVYKATCTDGFCIQPLDESINKTPCADAGPGDAATEGG